MQSVLNQHLDQLPQAFVSINKDTFPHLPKISNAIGLSTPAMDEVPAKTFKQKLPTKSKGYKKSGCFLRDLDPVSFNPTVDPPPRTCYNCWGMGHLVHGCPKTLTDIFCCNCGRRYVKIDECPRCARLFWDLDESARQWLLSYIPGVNQDDQTDCKRKEDSTDRVASYSGKDDFGKVEVNSDCNRSENLKNFECASDIIQVKSSKNANVGENIESLNVKFNKHDMETGKLNNLKSSTEFIQVKNDEKEDASKENNNSMKLKIKQEKLSEYDGCQTTNSRRISDSSIDQWWNFCNTKEESETQQIYYELKTDRKVIDNENEIMNLDEQFDSVFETERTKEENYGSFLDDQTNYHSDDNLQAANPNAQNIFEKHFNSFDDSLRTTSDQDDDYDNIIFDEEEQVEESCVEGNAVRDFALLLKAAKYLPFQQQNKLVLKFASDCKKKL